MIHDGLNKSLSIALIKQYLNLVPLAIEAKVLLEGLEFQIRVEVLAFLENAHSETLLDERSVDGEGGVESDGVVEGLGTLLGDLEGRVFGLDELEEDGDLGAASDQVSVLEVDLVD